MFGMSASLFYSIVWGIVLLFCVIAEASTATLVAIWFMPGVLISLILAVFSVPFGWQIGVFVVLSAVALLLSRPVCKRLKGKEIPTNIDALIGKDVLIIEDVDNLAGIGAAKLDGKIWTARASVDGTPLPAGTPARVVAISGVKLICEPLSR